MNQLLQLRKELAGDAYEHQREYGFASTFTYTFDTRSALHRYSLNQQEEF